MPGMPLPAAASGSAISLISSFCAFSCTSTSLGKRTGQASSYCPDMNSTRDNKSMEIQNPTYELGNVILMQHWSCASFLIRLTVYASCTSISWANSVTSLSPPTTAQNSTISVTSYYWPHWLHLDFSANNTTWLLDNNARQFMLATENIRCLSPSLTTKLLIIAQWVVTLYYRPNCLLLDFKAKTLRNCSTIMPDKSINTSNRNIRLLKQLG